MPSGKPVDWANYDQLIIEHLPKLTIEQFTTQFVSHISTKAVGARARKLGVKPAKFKPTEEQKATISASMVTETPELVEQIKSLRQTTSIKNICAILGVDNSTLWRIINRHKIILTEEGKKRARDGSRQGSIGKITWNKGVPLSDETKAKISIALRGEKNGQFGRGMTEVEKDKWRLSYFSNGINCMRQWLKSSDGIASLTKTITTITTPEFRKAASERAKTSIAVSEMITKSRLPEQRAAMSALMAELISKGRIRPHSNHSHGYHQSPKAGEVYYRSSYELIYFKRLDADNNVLAYEVEPFALEYDYNNTTLMYTPDVLIYYDARIVLVEIKAKYWLASDENQAKIKAASEYCSKYEIEFITITEDDLGE